MDALAIAYELRAEALALYTQAGKLQEIAMILDGTHYSLPDELRATEEERLARMTPEERERFDELQRRWHQRRGV